MERSEIVQKLKTHMEDMYPHPGEEILPDTDLLNEWFVDSFGIVQVVVFLEETFGVDIKPNDVNVQNFLSIATLTEYIIGQVGEGGGSE